MSKKVISYGAKIIDKPVINDKIFDNTVAISKESVSFIIDVVEKEWQDIKDLATSKEKVNYVEKLIHETKDNSNPKYSMFDKLFYKFPSYLRRNNVSEAIGIVSSYHTNLDKYEKERYKAISSGKKFKKKVPKLSLEHNKFPVLFKGNMFNKIDDNTVQIKVYKNFDWVWLNVKLRNQDIKYIQKNCYLLKELSPALEKKGMNYKLKFSYEYRLNLPKEKPIKDRLVCTVDLGINTSAVCSIATYNGTVLAEKFINPAKEKDHMYRLINKVSKAQYEGGRYAKIVGLWRKIDNIKSEITNQVVNKIIKFALENNADVIVLEYLGKMKLRGYGAKRNRRRIQNWNKRTISSKLKEIAHRKGMRYAFINPKNTSSLAYDGSGKVERNKKNFSICKFSSGKVYNCDLNATKNIAARYFIREIEKSMDESSWLQFKAKVPELAIRTNCTLNTLISLVRVLNC